MVDRGDEMFLITGLLIVIFITTVVALHWLSEALKPEGYFSGWRNLALIVLCIGGAWGVTISASVFMT